MRFSIIMTFQDGVKTEEYFQDTRDNADNRFYNQLCDDKPQQIELWKVNRRGKRCELLNVCAEKDSSPYWQTLFDSTVWESEFMLPNGVKAYHGHTTHG